MSVYLAVCKQRGGDLGDPVTCGRMSLVDRRQTRTSAHKPTLLRSQAGGCCTVTAGRLNP